MAYLIGWLVVHPLPATQSSYFNYWSKALLIEPQLPVHVQYIKHDALSTKVGGGVNFKVEPATVRVLEFCAGTVWRGPQVKLQTLFITDLLHAIQVTGIKIRANKKISKGDTDFSTDTTTRRHIE